MLRKWGPLNPEATARALLLQRLLDPVALVCAVVGLGLFVLTLPGMMEQLCRDPLPLHMLQERHIIWCMAGVAMLCFVAARGVVSTR